MFGLIVSLRDKYRIVSNRESRRGRYDIAMYALQEGQDAFIMEFKVHDAKKERNLTTTAENAMRQIEEKRYEGRNLMRKSPFSEAVSEEDLSRMGITAFGDISTSDIVFSETIRHICEDNRCQNYGKTWACPPAVGTLEECRSKCSAYSRAFIFASTYKLEDSFDFEGMIQGHQRFKEVCDRVYEQLTYPFLLLSNEGCIRCKECTYPDSPCRFPDRLFPSLEGYGILVNELANSAGMPYSFGANTVTYFGLVCYD